MLHYILRAIKKERAKLSIQINHNTALVLNDLLVIY